MAKHIRLAKYGTKTTDVELNKLSDKLAVRAAEGMGIRSTEALGLAIIKIIHALDPDPFRYRARVDEFIDWFNESAEANKDAPGIEALANLAFKTTAKRIDKGKEAPK